MIAITNVLNNSVQKKKIVILPLDEDGELAVDHPMKITSYYTQAMDDIELLNEAGNEFSEEKIVVVN